MLTGVAIGVATAFVLAGQNILAAATARRLGTLLTSALSLALALAIMAVFALVAQLRFPADPARYGGVAVLALFAASSFILWYRALQLGPVAVVSPITATSGAVTVIFAVVLLGEQPTSLQWLAVPVATAGAVLASVERSATRSVRLVGPGPVLAALGTILGSVSNAGLRIPIRDLGPVQAIIGQRVFTVLIVWLIVAIAWRSAGLGRSFARRSEATRSSRTWLLLAALGLVDAVGFILYAVGLYIADAWLIALISQSGRVFAVFGGLVIFGERLRPHQWLGVGLVTLAIAMIAAP